ncbi:MAG TPA: hypothetical protein VLJ15_07045 [Gammaproteobacteria bacterium]|nr:hypothetical protein [Gammaproteobacteria bacterium]
MENTFFKKSLIVFWTLFWTITLWTDIVGGLSHFGILVKSWAPDPNYPFLVQSLRMYNVPEWMPFFLFMLILAGSALSSFSFIWACFALKKEKHIWMARARVAFIISIIFWLTFFIADLLVMKFDLVENHMVQGGFELLCFFALYVLPD